MQSWKIKGGIKVKDNNYLLTSAKDVILDWQAWNKNYPENKIMWHTLFILAAAVEIIENANSKD